jgi:hypothetical protein
VDGDTGPRLPTLLLSIERERTERLLGGASATNPPFTIHKTG